MDVAHLLTQTATIVNVTQDGAADDMGDPTDVETTSTARCWLWQNTRHENTANQDSQFEEWSLALDSDATVDGSSRVTVDGVTYQLYGPPWRAHNPRTGLFTHIEATVRRTA